MWRIFHSFSEFWLFNCKGTLAVIVTVIQYGRVQILEITVTNQNHIHDEIKSRLNIGNVYYHSIQNFVFVFHLMGTTYVDGISEWYALENIWTWDDRCAGENCITGSFIVFTIHQLLGYQTVEYENSRACHILWCGIDNKIRGQNLYLYTV